MALAPVYIDTATTGTEPVKGNVIDVVNSIFKYEFVFEPAAKWAPEGRVLGTEGVADGVATALRELRKMGKEAS